MAGTSRDAFVQVLAHLREPVMLIGSDGRIVAGNVAAAEALNTTVDVLAGAVLASFCADPDELADQMLESSRRGASFPMRSRDGRRFSCDVSVLVPELYIVRLSGGPEAEKRARAYFETITRLESFTSSEPRSVSELSRTMLTFGMSSVGARAGGMFLLDENGTTLELVASIGYTEEAVAGFRLVGMAAEIPLTNSVRTKNSLFLATPDDYASHNATFAKAYPKIVQNAMACVPLLLEGECIGTVGLGFATPWQFTQADREFLHQFADQCAQTLQAARDEDARGTQDGELTTSRFERLHAFTGALALAITPADVAEAALDAGMAATGARSGGLWLRAEDNTVSLVRSVGPTGPRPEHFSKIPLERAPRLPVFDAIRLRTPIWLESCRQLEVRYPEAFAAFSRGGESSLACVPLIAQGRCVGAIAYNYDHTHRFHERERAFFQVLTWYAAQALERARLYAAEMAARASAEASQRRSAFLAESDAFLASLDYQATLGGVARALVPRIADWCVVELEEERARDQAPVILHADPSKLPLVTELLNKFRARGESEHGMSAIARTGRSHLDRTVTAERLGELLQDPELVGLAEAVGIGSQIAVPISARGKSIGALAINRTNRDGAYDELDLAMIEEFGRKVGLAIENARLYRDMRETGRLKDEFLAMLSHELRNPLVPIVAAVDLLGLHDDDNYAQERGLIRRNVRHLVRLVDDLLDVSRITRGKIQLKREPCELSDLVAEAVDIAFPLIEERGHRLTLTVARHGLPVLTDRVRMTQAIANLLTNAAKYTDRGGWITITARVDGTNAVLVVADSGIGISSDLLPRIFDMFVQASGTVDRSQGGLGIGLTIVKSVVDLHGGSIVAQSAGSGTGTELVMRLPLDALARPQQTSAVATRAMVSGKRVIVVDDNHDAAAVISELMMAVGFITRVAHDGSTALVTAREFQPDLALLDLGLPHMDGYELARRLRDLFPDLRIVAISGYAQHSDRERSRDAGFDEHVVKPVDLETLRQVVASLGVT